MILRVLLVFVILACSQVADAARLRFPKSAISFETPQGYKKVTVPGFLWCGRNKAGERVTAQLLWRKTGLTQLAPVSSERLYPRLHRKVAGEVIKRGPDEGFWVNGASASLVVYERKQYGKPFRSYQVLVLNQGNLYVFEYAAPAALSPKGVRNFNRFVESIHWPVAGKVSHPRAPTAPPRAAPSQQKQAPKVREATPEKAPETETQPPVKFPPLRGQPLSKKSFAG